MHAQAAKVWLVTGASRGLGRHVVIEALRAGNKVVAGYRKLPSSDDFSKQYTAEQYLAVELDVTCQDTISAAITLIVDHFGTLDVLINNAGFGNLRSIEETPMEDFRRQMDTNLFGVIACTKAVLPLMRKKKSGHIIQISSVGGQLGPPGRGPYAAAKWGVEGFSEVLANETRPFGIQVTIVEPGGFRTDFAANSKESATESTIEDYESTVGNMIRYQTTYSGKQPGDPQKAATAIVRITEMQQPPLRIALGIDAFDAIQAKNTARAAEHDKFKTISCSEGFEQIANGNRMCRDLSTLCQ